MNSKPNFFIDRRKNEALHTYIKLPINYIILQAISLKEHCLYLLCNFIKLQAKLTGYLVRRTFLVSGL